MGNSSPELKAFLVALDELTDEPTDLFALARRCGVGKLKLGNWVMGKTGSKAMRQAMAAREYRARFFLADSFAQATRAIGGIAERPGEGKDGPETQRRACVDAMKFHTELNAKPVDPPMAKSVEEGEKEKEQDRRNRAAEKDAVKVEQNMELMGQASRADGDEGGEGE